MLPVMYSLTNSYTVKRMSKYNPFLGYLDCLFATHITQKWVVFTATL